jgi:hypothetical protein
MFSLDALSYDMRMNISARLILLRCSLERIAILKLQPSPIEIEENGHSKRA